MAGPDRQSFLDRPAARALALAVILLCVASLAYLHRDDLFPKPEDTAIAADDPAAACIEERFAGIDEMVADGTINMSQAELFKQRAEAMCRDTRGGNNPQASPLPGLEVE